MEVVTLSTYICEVILLEETLWYFVDDIHLSTAGILHLGHSQLQISQIFLTALD